MQTLKKAWFQAGMLFALLVCAMLSAGAQTWQAQARKTPVVVENSACNAATDKLGVTAAPVTILVCKNGLWSKQDGADVVTPLYLRKTDAEPAACPSSWVQTDIGYVHESASGGNYVRTCLPPSTQACSVMYLKNANGAPASCPATWSQADLAPVNEGGTANNIRACVSCAVQPSSCTGPDCAVTPASSCTVPWGGVIAHGASVTAYASATVPYGNTCQAQTRTCSNGALSGSNTIQACTVSQQPIYGWVDDPSSPIYGWVTDYSSPQYGWTDGAPIYGYISTPVYGEEMVPGREIPIYGQIRSNVSHGRHWWNWPYPDDIPITCTDTPGSVIENEEYLALPSHNFFFHSWDCATYTTGIIGYQPGPLVPRTVIIRYDQVWGITGYEQVWGVTGYAESWGVTGYNQVWGIIGYR